MLRFRVLGPVEAEDDGVPVKLGPKPRALLAMLLLGANEVVSRDRLIDGLWGDVTPADPPHALDVQMSILRRTLAATGGPPLIRRPPGYMLEVPPDALDLHRFESIAGAGREALGNGSTLEAAQLLHDAVALWRGPVLGDVLFAPFAAPAARDLEERRLAVLEERIDADLELGLDRELIAELQGLVRAQPLRERLIGALMIALYRSGRQATALEVLASARRRFAEELGLQPGPGLGDLEQRILRGDPTLLRSPPSRGEPPRGPEHHRRGARALAAAVALAAAALGAVVLASTGSNAGTSLPDVSGIAALSTSSGRALMSVTLPGTPAAVAADDSGVWVVDPDDNLLARLDARMRTVTARLTLPSAPAAVALGDRAVWVASALAGTVARVDEQTQRVTQTIRVGGRPSALSFGGGAVWVADAAGRILRLDPATGRRQLVIHVDDPPTAIAVGGRIVWMTSYQAGTVTAVEAATGARIATIRVGGGPVAVATGDAGTWVANSLDATVSQVDPRAGVRATVPVGGGPVALALAGGALWVANESAGTVSRLDAARRTVTRTVAVGAAPTALAVVRDRLWVGTQPTGAQHRGGTLRLLGSDRVAPTIDPQFQVALPSPQYLGLSYDGLVAFRRVGGPRGGTLVPDLAIALPSASAGGTRYTFRLRAGIRYWTGAPVRPSDFVRSVERVFRGRSLGTAYLSGLVGAQRCQRHPARCRLPRGVIADDRTGTIEFRLSTPDRDFPFRLAALNITTPIPPGVPDRQQRTRPIPGTGPYRIAHADAHEVRFVRNRRFREWSHAAQPAGYPDAILWRFGGDIAGDVGAVLSGHADRTTGAIPPPLLTEAKNRHAAQLHINGLPQTEFLQLSTAVPPFNNVLARRALNYALDRRVVLDAYGGPEQASATCQVLAPSMPGRRRYCPYTRSPRTDGAWTAPDVARARRLVVASGTAGARVEVWRNSDYPTPPARVAAHTTRVLRRIGYRARVRTISGAAYDRLSRRALSRMQIETTAWTADFLSPSNFFEPWIACNGSFTAGRVCSAATDRRIARAHAVEATDPARADRMWQALDRQTVNAALWVPLVNPHQIELVSRRLGNYQYNALVGFIADQAWLH